MIRHHLKKFKVYQLLIPHIHLRIIIPIKQGVKRVKETSIKIIFIFDWRKVAITSKKIHKILISLRTWKIILAIILYIVLLSVISFAVRDISRQLQEKERVEKEYATVTSEVEKLEKVVQQYPNYRDGFFKLALLEYRLENKEKAKLYVEKALKIDPNFEKGRELEEILKQ